MNSKDKALADRLEYAAEYGEATKELMLEAAALRATPPDSDEIAQIRERSRIDAIGPKHTSGTVNCLRRYVVTLLRALDEANPERDKLRGLLKERPNLSVGNYETDFELAADYDEWDKRVREALKDE